MDNEMINSSSDVAAEVVGAVDQATNGNEMVITCYDGDTNIQANENAKESFEEAASTMKAFEYHLKSTARTLQSIGLTFDEVDKMCSGKFARSGAESVLLPRQIKK